MEITPEDEEEMIRKVAQSIHRHGIDVAAIFMIESIKPVSYVGTHMGRLFVSPFFPLLGENAEVSGEKFLRVFEKRDNLKRLIEAVEELSREEEERKKDERSERAGGKDVEAGEASSKGWRRFIPFMRG
jgi:hypothetical protein